MDQIKLNPPQQQAVKHTEGPLLLIAGAGTGKTRVITEKIRYFLENKLAQSEEILALTFTEKAAEEMVERVDEMMPLGYQEPWISTFHSFCDRILHQEGLEIGLDPNYKIITASEQWILIRQHLFEFELDYYRPLGNPAKFISSLVTLFSRIQDENITAEEYLDFASKNYKLKTTGQKGKEKNKKQGELLDAKKQLELAKAFGKYQQLKLTESKLDFGDLITYTLKLFKERPNILKKYQTQFKLIMVDEFQDTNYAQYQLVRLLAPAKSNPLLMVVGDDDQSIYKWRGASITNVMYFKEDYPNTKILTLADNYRSNAQILEASYQFIQHNPNRLETKLNISKKLTPHYQNTTSSKSSSSRISILEFATEEEEADQTVQKLIEFNQQGYAWKEMAILARANNHLNPYTSSLKKYEVPYQLIGNRGLFEQEEVKYLIAFLKAAANQEDSLALFQFLHTPVLGISHHTILKLTNRRKKDNTSLYQTLLETDDESIHTAKGLVQTPQKSLTTTPASTLLLKYINNSNYLQTYLNKDSLENQLKLENINRFFELIKRFESEISQDILSSPNTLEFLDYLKLLQEAGENPAQAEIEDIDTVNLMTIHAAKGLEFKVVVVPCLIKTRFPTRNRSELLDLPAELVAHREREEQSHLEEERRLFYVACTRAQEQLMLTHARNYGGKRETKPSPFLEELGMTTIDNLSSTAGNQLGFFDKIHQTPQVTLNTKTQPPKLELKTISYTQLDNFKTCPLMYKYAYVLRLPTSPSGALNFGQTLHRTLRDFHRRTFFGQNPSLDELLEIYEKQWIPGGYDSVEHQRQAKNHGREILADYFTLNQPDSPNHERGEGEAISSKLATPVYLEQKFTLRFGDVKLVGSIDRIGKRENGTIEIVDYKTGSASKKEKDLQKQADKSDQLTIYALAALEALKIKADELCLYFLEHGFKAVTTRTPDQLEDKRKDIMNQIKEMKISDFSAIPGFHCRWCAYNRICPEAELKL